MRRSVAALLLALPAGPGWRPRLAFVLVDISVGLSFPQQRLFAAAIFVVLIGLLEIMQRWASGRHARLEHFVVDAATACIGLAGAAGMIWLAARSRGFWAQ